MIDRPVQGGEDVGEQTLGALQPRPVARFGAQRGPLLHGSVAHQPVTGTGVALPVVRATVQRERHGPSQVHPLHLRIQEGATASLHGARRALRRQHECVATASAQRVVRGTFHDATPDRPQIRVAVRPLPVVESKTAEWGLAAPQRWRAPLGATRRRGHGTVRCRLGQCQRVQGESDGVLRLGKHTAESLIAGRVRRSLLPCWLYGNSGGVRVRRGTAVNGTGPLSVVCQVALRR
ncbi:hypothetical protein STCU_10024 [Strigomonas culicis]|uniref:Uncharacterized protein n=1 Tax=Strigomonas culicis TaxID=28005 RepID=S9TJP7_9TRYP|nr:hypothetical protein STCU_10024 [Strigomonas culicis]|eukprot:EPY18352.1 hypothetical protein STCU_10024 [Strigomonas culicis]